MHMPGHAATEQKTNICLGANTSAVFVAFTIDGKKHLCLSGDCGWPDNAML